MFLSKKYESKIIIFWCQTYDVDHQTIYFSYNTWFFVMVYVKPLLRWRVMYNYLKPQNFIWNLWTCLDCLRGCKIKNKLKSFRHRPEWGVVESRPWKIVWMKIWNVWIGGYFHWFCSARCGSGLSKMSEWKSKCLNEQGWGCV